MQGFITNNPSALVTAITNAFAAGKSIGLNGDRARDNRAGGLPAACHWSHLELELDETSATVAKITAMICWDATGDNLILGPTAEIDLQAGLTDTSLRNVAIRIDAFITVPDEITTVDIDDGVSVFVFLKTDAGQVTCRRAILHWADRART